MWDSRSLYSKKVQQFWGRGRLDPSTFLRVLVFADCEKIFPQTKSQLSYKYWTQNPPNSQKAIIRAKFYILFGVVVSNRRSIILARTQPDLALRDGQVPALCGPRSLNHESYVGILQN